MAVFLTGKELNDFIYDIIWKADEKLLIVSPFIKLDDYFKQMFENHKHNHNLEITIVFGKNEAAPNKSLRESDFEFFKQFKNIAIIYCADLHAKYYGNEKNGVITSINLYDKSFEKNIEYGVGYTVDFLDQFQKTVDTQAWQYSKELANTSPLVYLKRPVYESGLLSNITGKRTYIDTEVLYDATNEIAYKYRWDNITKRYLKEFKESIDISQRKKERPVKVEPIVTEQVKPDIQMGFCIRTGVSIPFNPEKPMCYDAFKAWVKYENYEFPEKFCHKSGKPSYGKTSMKKPIIYYR